jgi:hypothetical protein
MLTDQEIREMAAREFRGAVAQGDVTRLVAEVRFLLSALDAEREQCARLAEQASVEAQPGDVQDPSAFYEGAEQTGKLAAARIRTRKGRPPAEPRATARTK